MLANNLNYIENDKMKGINDDINEVERMLKALIKSLGKRHSTP